MSEDIYVTADVGTELAPTGDWRAITGDEQLAQQITLLILSVVKESYGRGITVNDITNLTGDIYDRLTDFDRIDGVRRVVVEDVDDETITLRVDCIDDSIAVPLTRN